MTQKKIDTLTEIYKQELASKKMFYGYISPYHFSEDQVYTTISGDEARLRAHLEKRIEQMKQEDDEYYHPDCMVMIHEAPVV